MKLLTIPVVEEFYSLQGEGFHTGKPAYFIRVGGCEVGCAFCDEKRSWNAGLYPQVSVDDIAKRVADCPAKAVVVTGGEPMLYDMEYLCNRLHEVGATLFLETSGSEPITGDWDWICLSPKYGAHPLESALQRADELKVIVGSKEDFEWAEKNAALVRENCLLYLQPDWNRCHIVMKMLVEYALQHPKWSISLQSHIYLSIQ